MNKQMCKDSDEGYEEKYIKSSENDSGCSRWASWRRCHLSKRKERGSSSYKSGGAVSQAEGMALRHATQTELLLLSYPMGTPEKR